MVPRDTGSGRSFKGAGLYYLHDKDAETNERVAWTHTENLITDDPEKALKVMAWTACHAEELKAAAGEKSTGRKLQKPVFTYSLSWAQGEAPEQAHMIETGRSSLEALGLQHHEALFVAHRDTEHRHLHVIVNRVNPDTGIANTLSKSRLKLSQWAEAYEREHGIHCHQRIKNNQAREQGKNIVDLDSRRREREQFSDWRARRKQEARDRAFEQARFKQWQDNRRTDLQHAHNDQLRRLQLTQEARNAPKIERLLQQYDTRNEQAKMARLDKNLSYGGLTGWLRRVSGVQAHDQAARDALARTIADAKRRHQEALGAIRQRDQAEQQQLKDRQAQETKALDLRLERSRAQREREQWQSHPRKAANDQARQAGADPTFSRKLPYAERLAQAAEQPRDQPGQNQAKRQTSRERDF